MGMKPPKGYNTDYGPRCNCNGYDRDGHPLCKLDFRIKRGIMLRVGLVVEGRDRRTVAAHSVRYAHNGGWVSARWRCDACNYNIPKQKDYDQHSVYGGNDTYDQHSVYDGGGGGGDNYEIHSNC